MKFGSVCSGLEAASLAWNPLGWKAQFFSEIEAAPSVVLATHYPDVPNFGDMNNFKEWPDVAIELLVGGTPCQSFSNAGLRQGLDDPRGTLMLVYGAIAARYRPRWLVWENVPGVLSSNEGRDFASLLGLLSGQRIKPPANGWQNGGFVAGDPNAYGLAWRVLDAQYFGLAQRRKRVFVVGYLGDWRPPAAVFLEREGLSGNPAPRRKTRQDVAGTLGGSSQSGGFRTTDLDNNEAPIAAYEPFAFKPSHYTRDKDGAPSDVYPPLSADADKGDQEALIFDTTQITNPNNRSNPKPGDPCHGLSAHQHPPAIAFSRKDYGQDVQDDVAPTLRAMNHSGSHENGGGQMAVAYYASEDYQRRVRVGVAYGDYRDRLPGESSPDYWDRQLRHEEKFGPPAPSPLAFELRGREEGVRPEISDLATLRAASGGSSRSYIAQTAVRRLTPRECERLQGVPDDFTLVTYRGKPMADGPRYKMLGNSMPVPVMRWIGERIELVDEIVREGKAA